MNSNNVSKLFPSGTVIVAYKGITLGGAEMMPQWKIEPIINENRYFRPSNGLLAKLAVNNSIIMEFEVINPQHLNESYDLYSSDNFDNTPGGLTFVPLDPEKEVAYYFPLAELKHKAEVKNNNRIRWKFEILFDNNGVFMEELKTNN